jgi:hypothetical protein
MDDFDDDTDACSIMVPVDAVGTPGVIQSITAGGVTLAEDTNAAWSSGTTYTIGQRVYSLSTHKVYESVKDGNLNKDPTVLANQQTATGVGTWWYEVGPTNRTAMFDGMIETQTLATSPLVITLRPGAFNGFALFGVDADSISVVARDAPGGTIVYSETNTVLEGSQPADYFEYFFDPFEPSTQVIRTGLTPYGQGEITLTLTRAGGSVGLGMYAIGDLKPIGIPQRDASVEPEDFSVIREQFGVRKVTRRGNATGMSISTIMEKEKAGSILRTVQKVLGTPVVVVGSEAEFFEWMTVFGLVSGKMTPVPYPYATLSITVKGFL